MNFGLPTAQGIGFTPPRTLNIRFLMSGLVSHTILRLCCTEGVSTEGIELFWARYYTPRIEQQLLCSFSDAPVNLLIPPKLNKIIGVFPFQAPGKFTADPVPATLGRGPPEILYNDQ
jgi:hypothetical protein